MPAMVTARWDCPECEDHQIVSGPDAWALIKWLAAAHNSKYHTPKAAGGGDSDGD